MVDTLNTDPATQAQIIDLVTRERAKALSPREWRHRLAGHGYGIRTTEAGAIVESLRSRAALCVLPAGLAV